MRPYLAWSRLCSLLVHSKSQSIFFGLGGFSPSKNAVNGLLACVHLLTGLLLGWLRRSAAEVTFWLLVGRRSRLCRHYCIIDLSVVVSQCTFVLEQTTALIILLHPLLDLKRNCRRMSCCTLINTLVSLCAGTRNVIVFFCLQSH